MSADSFIAGVGHATHCGCVREHRPTPARYVWHHILPKTCGGRSTNVNLVSLCDTAHYAIHSHMWRLAHGTDGGRVNQFVRDYAQRGYDAAVAAGTVGKIPDPGEAVATG